MKFPSFTLTPLIICFVLGVLYFFQFGANSLFTNSQLLFLSLISLAIAWRVKKRHSSFFLVGLCIISFLIGINRGQQALQQSRDHYTFEYHKKEPNELLIEITDRLRPTATYHRYYGAVRALNNQKASGKLLVRIKKKDSLTLELSSIIKTSNLLSPISASQNIGGFNYKGYLSNLRIFHQLEIDTLKVVENKKLGMRSWLRKLKQSQLNSIESSSFKTETKQLLMTLLLGERSELDRALADRYAQAGIIHILAISGLHMGLLMILLGWLFKPLRYLPKGNYIHVIMVILSLWTYAFITGANPSVIRAATIFSLYSIGTYLKRSPPTLFLLLLSFGVLIFSDPLYLKQLGFQMSYLAVFGILSLQPILVKIIPIKKGLFRKFWIMTTVTLAAQIAVSPLAIHHFNQFPGLFLITNWVALPFVAIFLYLGIGSLFLLHWKILPSFLVQVLDLMTNGMNKLVLWVVAQDSFFIEKIKLNVYEVFLCYALLVFLYLTYIKSKKKVIIGIFLGIITLQWLAFKSNVEDRKITAVWLLPSFNNTVLAYKKEETLSLYSSEPIQKDHSIITDFQKKYSIKKTNIKPLKNSYALESTTLLIIDSIWAEAFNFKHKSFVVVLTKNTKINLEALVERNEIKQIIVDGSSYPNQKKRWQKTCKQFDIPFHDTQKEGPFLFSAKPWDIAF